MVAGGSTHDISLATATAIYGFKLKRDPKTGWPVYSRGLAGYLGNSSPDGKVTIDNTDPRKLLIREQASFSKGFGQVDFEDESMYYDSTDCEATVPGRVYLGPDDTTESAIAPTLTNGGFETAIGAEWTATGERTTTWPNEGSAELTCDAGENAVQTISWTTAYRSKTIVVTVAAMVMVTGGTGTLTIDDGVDTTTATGTFTAGSGTATSGTAAVSGSPQALVAGANTVTLGGAGNFTLALPIGVKATATTDTATLLGSPVSCHEGNTTLTVTGAGNVTVTISLGTWKGISASHTLNAAATQLTITVTGVDQQCLFDSVKIATPTRLCQFAGYLYQARGARLEKWSGTAWAAASATSTFLHEITDLKTYTSYLVVALGHTSGSCGAYVYSTGGSTFTMNTAGTKVRLWGVLSGTLYGVANGFDYSIYTVTTVTGATASPIIFYETTYAITKIIEHPDTLYIVKDDSLWTVTSGAAVLMMDMKADYHANTGKNSYAWHNDLFIPTNSGTLYRLIDADTVTNISPINYSVGLGATEPRVAAMVGDGEYLTAIMVVDTYAYVLRGHYAVVDGETAWYWHIVRKVSGITSVTDATIFSDSGVLKLFIAGGPGSCWLYHPEYYTTWHLGTSLTVTSGTFTTSKHYGDFRADNKAFYSLTVGAGGLAYTAPTDIRTITAYYSIDSGAWASLGTISNATPVYFPSGSKGKYVQFRFDLAYTSTGVDNKVSPYLEWYSYEAQLLPTDQRYEWNVAIDLAASTTIRSGATELTNSHAVITAINTIIRNGSPVTFKDIYGDTYYVTVQALHDQPGPIDETTGHPKEATISLQLLEARWTSS